MKKCLIIAHNALSKSTNNGRTLIELFNNYDSENIAQLFLHPDRVDCEFCTKNYAINEIDILKHLFSPGKIGKLIDNDSQSDETTPNVTKVYQSGSSKKSFMVFARELIWMTKLWFNKKLKNWLKDFNPDVIFYFAGDSTFSIKLTMKIAKFLNAPTVSFWTDDYYINNANKKGFFGPINNGSYKKNVKKLLKSSQFISLTDLMLTEYNNLFHVNGTCIYTATSMTPFEPKEHSQTLVMSFIGNISLGRYNSLIDIANTIKEMALPITFNVYTTEKRPWILNNILNVEGLNYCGEISYEMVKEIMRDSDILVHVEDFAKANIERVKYSLSTKIADSLASNRCLLAYGPKDVASINYLIQNNAGLIATSKNELKELLIDMCSNLKVIDEKALAGQEIAVKNHNAKQNQLILQEVFNKALLD